MTHDAAARVPRALTRRRHGARSVHIDVFGTLRGACKASGCAMWRRDVATAKNWSDTSVLTCQARLPALDAARAARL